MLIMKSGNRHMTEERALLNQEKIGEKQKENIGEKEKETNKYLGILEVETIKHARDERKHLKNQQNKKTTRNKTSFDQSDLYLRCLNGKIFGTRKEFQQMDQTTRKLITMHKAVHPRDDGD